MRLHDHGRHYTFGDLIVGVYGACGARRATALVRFAVNAGVLRLPRMTISRKHGDAGAGTTAAARLAPARERSAVADGGTLRSGAGPQP